MWCVQSPTRPAYPRDEKRKKIASTTKKSALIACFVCGERSPKKELFSGTGWDCFLFLVLAINNIKSNYVHNNTSKITKAPPSWGFGDLTQDTTMTAHN